MKREEAFSVGAILANVMMTEFVILATCVIWLMLGNYRGQSDGSDRRLDDDLFFADYLMEQIQERASPPSLP